MSGHDVRANPNTLHGHEECFCGDRGAAMTLGMIREHCMFGLKWNILSMLLRKRANWLCNWTLMDMLMKATLSTEDGPDMETIRLMSTSIAELAVGAVAFPMTVFVLSDIVSKFSANFQLNDFDALLLMLGYVRNVGGRGMDRVEATIYELKLSAIMVGVHEMSDWHDEVPDVSTDPLVVEKLPRAALVSTCTVCKDDADTSGTSMPCGHIFHTTCIRAWLTRANTCPLCRAELPASEIQWDSVVNFD
ncbi:hypothetical protein SARC_16491 [Sphaeroforma arctica JP610]|uniref:RING-type domain-containing protein n=1 Tax=Sphaeroforma arctica JP610 TaxID=667725 RepID=A0A0L0F2R3_9EUKA|nr:hypothetical protein SARC_16491 [Sphaeroforma arctica JP610]KNC70977.1 hypothetical protein SARC_16491 [Sphaeroforma arctica JP610]|eukprot:XP_014144879.1 hypothetical protein SARC_16491 [Sphaeroforma arctica JP610]